MVVALKTEHEIHKRRFSRNVGVGLTLAGLVVVILALSIVKMRATGPIQGYDYQMRPELSERAE